MILRHEDVRKAAKDWKTFSSDAAFRVPIPSEEHLRSVRQLPIEVDPPQQPDYRKLVEPFFLRAKQPAFVARVEAITERLVADAIGRDSIEAVGEFALPLQSRALTVLLDVPEEEAEKFIAWGVHVFHGESSSSPRARAESRSSEREAGGRWSECRRYFSGRWSERWPVGQPLYRARYRHTDGRAVHAPFSERREDEQPFDLARYAQRVADRAARAEVKRCKTPAASTPSSTRWRS